MESTLRHTTHAMAVSLLTAMFVFGACKTATTPKPTQTTQGLLLHTWNLPNWSAEHLALLDKHIIASDMNNINALHKGGGMWFSSQIHRDDRNQNTWITATRDGLALLYGLKSLVVYDMRQRKTLYRLQCPTNPCGQATIVNTSPVVIQLQTTKQVITSRDPKDVVMGHDGKRPPTKNTFATSWHVLQDKPWQVAWRWGMQTDAQPTVQVSGQTLMVLNHKTLHRLDLKSGNTTAKHTIALPMAGHVTWAAHQNRVLFASTSGKANSSSAVALLDLSTGQTTTKTINTTLTKVFATRHGWLLGGASSVHMWSWDLSTIQWQRKPTWATWNWYTAKHNANHVIGRQSDIKKVWVIDLKSGDVDWSIQTDASAEPLAIDAQSNVVTLRKDEQLGLWRAPAR